MDDGAAEGDACRDAVPHRRRRGGRGDGGRSHGGSRRRRATRRPRCLASRRSKARCAAGSVDDNLGFDDYLAYRARIAGLGIPLRGGDPSGRVVVTVTGADGHPVHGAVVTVSDGTGTKSLR